MGDRPRRSWSCSATSAPRCCSSRCSWRCCTSRRAAPSYVARRARPVRRRRRPSCTSCSATSRCASTSGSIRSPTRRAPGYQVVQALYAFGRGGHPGHRARRRAAGGRRRTCRSRRSTPTFRFAALGEELGLLGAARRAGPVPRRRRARPPDRRRGRRRLPGTPRHRPDAGDRGPGVHHRRAATCKLIPLTGDHAAVRLVRRLVAAGQRAWSIGLLLALSRPRASSRRPPRRGSRGRRAGRGGRRSATALSCAAPSGTCSRQRADPVAAHGRSTSGAGRSARQRRSGPGLASRAPFAGARRRRGLGRWSEASAPVATAPDNPSVIAVARRALARHHRRPQRHGAGAQRRATPTASASASTATPTSARSSATLARSTARPALERTYDAQLTGPRAAPTRRRPAAQVPRPAVRPGRPAAVARPPAPAGGRAGWASDQGAVVMLDPTTGEVLALASTPDVRRIGRSSTRTRPPATSMAASGDDDSAAADRARRRACTCPARCSRS